MRYLYDLICRISRVLRTQNGRPTGVWSPASRDVRPDYGLNRGTVTPDRPAPSEKKFYCSRVSDDKPWNHSVLSLAMAVVVVRMCVRVRVRVCVSLSVCVYLS